MRRSRVVSCSARLKSVRSWAVSVNSRPDPSWISATDQIHRERGTVAVAAFHFPADTDEFAFAGGQVSGQIAIILFSP